MLGFVCNGDAVGESEFSKMEAKELLKQQVKLVSHAIADQTQPKSTSKLNQFAKNHFYMERYDHGRRTAGIWIPRSDQAL